MEKMIEETIEDKINAKMVQFARLENPPYKELFEFLYSALNEIAEAAKAEGAREERERTVELMESLSQHRFEVKNKDIIYWAHVRGLINKFRSLLT